MKGSLKELKREYYKIKDLIKKRLGEFSKVKGDAIFYELCFCLLTPQSNAKYCWNKIEELIKKDFKNKNFNPKSIVYPIRFYNNKSNYLLKAKNCYDEINNILKNKDGREAREYLVKNVNGFGYKESSHFLRNIGFRNLAIFDRHILKNLKKFNVIDEIPKSLSKKNYLDIEKRFYEFSKKVNIPMDELDLLFWSLETGEVFK